MNSQNPTPPPDRMMSGQEMQSAQAAEARRKQVIQAMGEGALAATINVAQQAQLPPEQGLRLMMLALAQAANSVGQKLRLPPNEARAVIDQAFGVAPEEMRNRVGRKALDHIARGLMEDADGSIGHVTVGWETGARELLREADALDRVGEADGRPGVRGEDATENPTCGARFPRKGARCTLPPHEDGAHFDEGTGARWCAGDA